MRQEIPPTNDQSDHSPRSQATVAEVRLEQRREQFGIGTEKPRISWIINAAQENWCQSACQIRKLSFIGSRFMKS